MRHIYKQSMGLGVLYKICVYAIRLLCGYLIAMLITWLMNGRQAETFRLAFVILVILGVAIIPLFLINKAYRYAMGQDAQNFRELLYERLLHGKMHVCSRGEWEIKLRRDTQAVTKYFEETWPDGVGGAVILVGSTLLLCWLDWRVGLLFFFLNMVQLLPILIYEKWTRKIHNETCQAEEENSTWILEGYEGAHILKCYGARAWYLKRFQILEREVMRWGYRAEGAVAVEDVVFKAIDGLLNYGSYIILGLFALYGGVSVAQLPLLAILGGYLFSSISSIFSLWLERAKYQEAYRRLELDYQVQYPVEQSVHSASAAGKRGEPVLLSCWGVAKYFGEKRVLENTSLVIRRGDRILLQGKNGSGKSTLLRILLGLETADDGDVCIALGMEQISYALQEEAQTSLTVREMATELKHTPGMDSDALCRHMCQFHLQSCMNQPLVQLSSGQLKRFFLSAALAKRSQLLILDEPTNHLDQEGITYLSGVLQAYPGTLLVCTHGKLPDMNWNKIIHMQQGRIIHEA